jgi:hypothetical protein
MARYVKVAVLANCQGGPLAGLLRDALPNFDTTYFSNNIRTGGFEGSESILEKLREFDVVVYQPLNERHGAISDKSIQNAYSHKLTIKIPYIFNSGTTSLGYAPASPKNSYGEVYGEESIKGMIQKGMSKASILESILAGEFFPSITQRFDDDLDGLRMRETALDVKIADYIEENFRKRYLFISHNHPTPHLFYMWALRLTALIEPSRVKEMEKGLANVKQSNYSLPSTGSAVSPHDAATHGYSFGYHSDYREKMEHLINLVYTRHSLGEQVDPKIFSSSIIYPNSTFGA